VGFLIDKAYIMISTKINVDTSGILKAFDMVDKEGKVSADYLKKVFSDNIVIEVNDNEIKNLPKQAKKSFDEIDNEAKGLFANLKSSLNLGSILNFASGQIVADGIAKVGEGLGFLAEQASRADEIGTQLENGFRLAGLSGAELDKQLQETTKFARDFGFELGVAPERIKELSATAGALGGATGKMNQDLSKLAVGVEMATNGAIKGEQAIKIFSRGIADPENAEAIDKLKKSFPQLGEALLSANDPAGKLQAGLNALSGTFETMKNDTSDVEARFGIFKMQIAEGAQAIGGAFLSSFNTDKLLEFFGSMGGGVDIFKALENAGMVLGETLTNVLNSIISVVQTINNSPLFNTLKNNFELVSVALLTYLGYTKAIAYETEILAIKTKAYAIAQGIYNGVMTLSTTILTAFSNGNVIATAKTYLFATAQTLLNAIMSANPIGLVVVALGALTAGLVYAYKNSESFRKIIDGIWETMKGWLKSLGMIVTKVLEFFGILGKDVKVKATKEIEKDTKAIETNVTNTNVELDKQSTKVEKNVKAVKTLQQQYDELYKKTLEIADNSKFKLQYDANLIKLQKLKDEIEGNNVLKMKVDFDLKGGITWDDRNKLINDYLKNDVEVEEVAIRPKELTFALKNIKPIVIENAKLEPTFFETLEKDIASRIEKTVNGITLNFNNDSYKQAIKELNSETQSELDNLSNSLMSANISYEEYSEQKADILRNAKEKEMQIENEHQSNLFSNINNSTSALMQSIKEQYDNNFNDTLARTTANNIKIIEAEKVKNQALIDLENAKLANDTKLMADKQALIDESNKTIIDSTQIASDSMNSIYSTMAVSMGASLTDAIVQGKNAFDTLVGLAFDFLQKMVPIWSAQILAGSLATPQSIITAGGAGLVQWTAMTILIQGAVSAARAALGFKDGVINLQGEGTSRSDSIPAMLSKGESVINARSTAQNEPYLRYINNGGDMSKLVNMNMNTKNIENLLYTNNELLRSKNFNPSINNVNKFNVSSSSIKVVRGR